MVVKNSQQPQTAKPNQVKQSRTLRRQAAQQPNQNVEVKIRQPQSPPSNGVVVNKKRRGIRKATKVKYVSRGISPESVSKINAIRNVGRGKILIIVGNGPSLNEAPLQDLRGHSKIHTLSINKPDERIWPTTYWSFFDGSQMRRHEELWSMYGGYIFNSTSIKKQKEKSMQFKNIGGQGFSRDVAKGIHIGRSSVYASMQIALWMNYDHIYIFGCDMNPEGLNGQLHFYGVNPDVDPSNRADRFTKEAEFYDSAARILSPDERAKFTFCTDYNPWPFVSEYGQMSHKDVEEIVKRADKL